MRINLTGNTRTVINQLELDSKEFKLAVMRSLNRTADGLVTDAQKQITSTYQIKKKDLSSAFVKQKATQDYLVAEVRASGRPMPVYDFAPRPTTPGRPLPKVGASVSIKKGVRKVLRGAFIARMKSGHVGVFVRESATRFPIAERFTLSVPGMLTAEVVASVLEGLITDRFEKAMEQNVKYLTNR